MRDIKNYLIENYGKALAHTHTGSEREKEKKKINDKCITAY